MGIEVYNSQGNNEIFNNDIGKLPENWKQKLQ